MYRLLLGGLPWYTISLAPGAAALTARRAAWKIGRAFGGTRFSCWESVTWPAAIGQSLRGAGPPQGVEVAVGRGQEIFGGASVLRIAGQPQADAGYGDQLAGGHEAMA